MRIQIFLIWFCLALSCHQAQAADRARPECYGQFRQWVQTVETLWDDLNRPFPPDSDGPKITYDTRITGDAPNERIVYRARARHENIYGQNWVNPYRVEFHRVTCALEASRFYGTEGKVPTAY